MTTNTARALFVGYLASIVLGVWAVDAIGVVPVGFGLMAPAAVYCVGLSLVLRDLLQERTSVRVALLAVALGAGVSAAISPTLALASGVAFLASESIDLAVFVSARRFGLVPAILASNAVSVWVDSLVFLSLAFGSLTFLPGQVLGKVVATLVGVAALVVVRRIAR